jgi:hypothetical protein
VAGGDETRARRVGRRSVARRRGERDRECRREAPQSSRACR